MELQEHLSTYILGSSEAKSILNDFIARVGKKQVVIKADPDVDGLFSYIECLKAIEEIKKTLCEDFNIKSVINENRGHGYHEKDLEITDSLIIVVDSSYSSSELELLVKNRNDVIVLDHHELEDPSVLQYIESNGYRAVTVNNQYDCCDNSIRYWSGCGVVVNFFQGYYFKEYYSDRLISDVSIMHHGLTLLSDVRDIENGMARKVLETTFSTPIRDSEELSYLVETVYSFENQTFSTKPVYLTRNYIDYVFSPYFNASFQLNLGEYVLSLARVEWLSGINSKNLRKKVLSYLEENLKVQYMDYLTLIMINLQDLKTPNLGKYVDSDYNLTNFLGLLANKYLSHGKTVLIVAKDGGQLKRGSVRGIDSSTNYLELFGQAGFEVRGHKQAFGVVGVSPRGVDFNKLRVLIKQSEKEKSNSPDNIIKLSKMLENLEMIKEIAYENQFLLSQNQKRIKYTGIKTGVSKGYQRMVLYDVDGLAVRSYDVGLEFSKGLILPVHGERTLDLILESY